jgi:hypothetical protein
MDRINAFSAATNTVLVIIVFILIAPLAFVGVVHVAHFAA